jgi:hypothetical protein
MEAPSSNTLWYGLAFVVLVVVIILVVVFSDKIFGSSEAEEDEKKSEEDEETDVDDPVAKCIPVCEANQECVDGAEEGTKVCELLSGGCAVRADCDASFDGCESGMCEPLAVTLVSTNFPASSILAPKDVHASLSDANSTELKIVPGLCGDPSTVSLQLVSDPTYYLAPSENVGSTPKISVFAVADDETEDLRSRMCFRMLPGLDGTADAVSFQMLTDPLYHLRHFSLKMYTSEDDSSFLYKKDASFTVLEPAAL